MRKTQFSNNECYHIYNRGVDKREVFSNPDNYARFLLSLQEFNRVDPIGGIYQNSFKKDDLATKSLSKNKLVEIIAYCLNPNHYHLILKQLRKDGISIFMRKAGSGYSMYYNNKQKRSGSLFQGPFKSVHIDSNEYLLYVSAYVNCNSEIHKIHKADNYKWCSFPEYIKNQNGLCNKKIILGQFKNKQEYANFAKINAKEMKKKKELAKFILE